MKKSLILFTIIATTLSTSAFASTYDTNISAFKTRADAIIKEVNNFKPTGTYQQQITKYREIDMKIDKLDNDMDYYENTLERDYRNGKLSYNSFIKLDRGLEDIEYSFEDLDDVLEYKIASNNTQTPQYNAPASEYYPGNTYYGDGNYYYDDDYDFDDRYDYDDYYDFDDRYDYDDYYDFDDRYDFDDHYDYDDYDFDDYYDFD